MEDVTWAGVPEELGLKGDFPESQRGLPMRNRRSTTEEEGVSDSL